MLEIFDNDTIGREAYNRARALPLPSNVSVLLLPDIELARHYPSLGPQGAHIVDVNGTAASIELYLGRHSLTRSSGDLTPIRWRGYVDKLGSYQGELDDKSAITQRFDESLSEMRSPEAARAAFPELALLWSKIIDLSGRG